MANESLGLLEQSFFLSLGASSTFWPVSKDSGKCFGNHMHFLFSPGPLSIWCLVSRLRMYYKWVWCLRREVGWCYRGDWIWTRQVYGCKYPWSFWCSPLPCSLLSICPAWVSPRLPLPLPATQPVALPPRCSASMIYSGSGFEIPHFKEYGLPISCHSQLPCTMQGMDGWRQQLGNKNKTIE